MNILLHSFFKIKRIDLFSDFKFTGFCLHVCMCPTRRSGTLSGQKSIEFPGPGVTESYEHICRYWDSNSGPLENHPMLLTA